MVEIEFVSDILVMCGLVISVVFMVLCFCMILNMFVGRLVFSRILVSFNVLSGVFLFGLKIMVLFMISVGVVF